MYNTTNFRALKIQRRVFFRTCILLLNAQFNLEYKFLEIETFVGHSDKFSTFFSNIQFMQKLINSEGFNQICRVYAEIN